MDRADATKTARPTVLLVSDSPQSLPTVEEALAPLGIDTVRACSDEEALAELGRCAPFLAILDLGRSDSASAGAAEHSRLRAIEAWQSVRGQLGAQHTPIILLANAANDLGDALHGQQTGPVDVLFLPLTAALLRSKISLFLDLQRKTEQLEQQARELASANQILAELALTDPLTGVLNRRGLSEALGRESLRLSRDGSSLVAVLVDLDDFRDLNAVHGHGVGDAVLSEVANKLRTKVRRTDYVARVGGDQFVVLLPDTRPAEGALVAEKLRLTVSRAVVITPKGPVSVTASLAATKIAAAGASIDGVVALTGQLMQRSRSDGKNRVAADFGPHSPGRQLRGEIAELVDALQSGSCLRVARRPIVRLEDRKLIGFQLVCKCTAGGFEEPEDYLKVAAEAGIVTAVERHCLCSAAATAKLLPADVQCHVPASLSSVVVGLAGDVLAVLPAEHGPVRLELCEQELVGGANRLTGTVGALKDAGVGLVLTAVGYGRTCLESLVMLSPDMIKLDESLLTDAGGGGGQLAGSRALCRVLRIAEAIGCDVIAEGVNSNEIAEACQSVGIQYGQGTLWGEE